MTAIDPPSRHSSDEGSPEGADADHARVANVGFVGSMTTA